MLIDGAVKFACFILEPEKERRIPPGTYHLEYLPSHAFRKEVFMKDQEWYEGKLWEYVDDVDGHSEAKIHPGNTLAHTQRCQLPGMTTNPEKSAVYRSREALRELHSVLQPFEGRRVTATISDDFPEK